MELLPYFQSEDKNLSLLQTRWGSVLNKLLRNPITAGVFISSVLISGSNIINHRLGRKPQGYLIVDQDAAATFYRAAPFNELTLALNSSANVNVSLYVF